MVTSVILLTGPARSGKTNYLLSRYRSILSSRPPGSVLWLTPTWRAAAHVRDHILGGELNACWQPGIFTFDKFAQAILEHKGSHKGGLSRFSRSENGTVPLCENRDSPLDTIRPLSRLMKRQVVRRLIDEQLEQGRLQYFRPIASTSGLLDLACEFISELKRLEIWPEEFRKSCQARGFTAKDRELLDLYDAYQIILRENQLYDAEGRFWSARDLLQNGQRKPFENVCLAVADGFTDFTRTQHEIIELLAGWVDEIIISLPLESGHCRSDLFTKPQKTLDELKRRHKNLTIREFSRCATGSTCTTGFASATHDIDSTCATGSASATHAAWPAMSLLEKSLFDNPRTCATSSNCATGSASATHAPDIQGIEILAAAKPLGEMELIGAKIKRLLAEGIAGPSDIAVVFRSPQHDGGLAAEVFNRLGIPVAWELGQTLDRIPIMRAFRALLQLDLDDWPFRRLLAVLGNNYFQPDWPEWQGGTAVAVVERTIRNLQIPHGRKILLEQITAHAQENPTPPVLNRLAASFDALPSKATLPQWAKAWEKLALEIGLLRVQGSGFRVQDSTSSFISQDLIAWNHLLSALSIGDTLDGWLNRRSPELDRSEAFQALIDILGSQRMPVEDDESGRVRVISAASVRSLEVPYLFLAGLSEKAFPPSDREDRLYSEAEYVQLIEQGLPLVARTERAREEMLLFYESVTRATRRLYLSYPALDDAAQPLSPSPYVLDVIQALGVSIAPPKLTDIRPIPADDEPLSIAQFRVKAMDDALSLDNVSLLAGLLQSKLIELLPGLETIIFRQDREVFSPAEGILPGKAVQKQLAADFSPNRCFTASELEQYATCPYRFLLQNILKLEPLEDIALQLDFLERGQIVHRALASFHAKVNESQGRPSSPIALPPEDFDRLLQHSLEESLPKDSSNPYVIALREVNRRLITKWLGEYRSQCELYDKMWSQCDQPPVPELFEASFGESKHREAEMKKGSDPLTTGGLPPFSLTSPSDSADEPLEFTSGKDVIRIAGRIDRVDTGKVAGEDIFNVIDYKTGKTVKFLPEDVRCGKSLQLPLYALAAMELLLSDRDVWPWRAGYWNVSKDGFKEQKSLVMCNLSDGRVLPSDDWENTRMDMEEIIPALVQNIRRGMFPVSNSDRRCTGSCPFKTVCRINQIRSLEKSWLSKS
jgi:ATP-dependent helicase/nuclease subunit B